jgi:hypothetical protein
MAPHASGSIDRAGQNAVRDTRRHRPTINGGLHLGRDRYGAHMSARANQSAITQ